MDGPAPGGADASWRLRVAFVAFVALLVVPAFVVDVPPLSDFPNHLARVHVLARLLREPGLHLPWVAEWAALPNLAVDLPGVLLAPTLGLERFGRLFVAAAVVVWALGCRSLGRALLGRDTLRALVAAAFVWSEPLLLGYAGFVLGAGLALHAVAAVARTLGGGGLRASAWAAALGLVATVAHVGGAVILFAATAGLVAAHVLSRRGPENARLAVLSLAPGGLYVAQWWWGSASQEPGSFATRGMVVRAFASPLTGLDAPLDHVSLALLALLAVAFLVRARPLGLHLGAACASGAGAMLVVVFPSDLAGAIEVHGRFALAAWVFATFAVVPRTPLPQRRGRPPLAVLAVVALLGARTVHLAGELRALDGEAWAIRHLLANELPPGARLGTVWFFPDDRLPAAERVRALATLHVPALAVVDREAHLPTLYALPGAQPLRYVGGLPRAHRFGANEPGPSSAELAVSFDFVWRCGGPERLGRELRARGELRGVVGRCELWATGRQSVAVARRAGPT